MRETAGMAAEPAARCRNWRRGSFVALTLSGWIAASAWSVVDDKRLSKPLRQPLPHQARVEIGRTAGGKANDDAHRYLQEMHGRSLRRRGRNDPAESEHAWAPGASGPAATGSAPMREKTILSSLRPDAFSHSLGHKQPRRPDGRRGGCSFDSGRRRGRRACYMG
jgi:hypothetical protein